MAPALGVELAEGEPADSAYCAAELPGNSDAAKRAANAGDCGFGARREDGEKRAGQGSRQAG